MVKKTNETKKKNSRRKISAAVSGDTITVHNEGNQVAIAAGRGAEAIVNDPQSLKSELEAWRSKTDKAIDKLDTLSTEAKKAAKEDVKVIAQEIAKGKSGDLSWLEKRLNTLIIMAPDILDVVSETLLNPLKGIGVTLKKIGDQIQLERLEH